YGRALHSQVRARLRTLTHFRGTDSFRPPPPLRQRMTTPRVSREEFEAWNEKMVQDFDPGHYHEHPSALVRFIEGRRVDTLLRFLDARPVHKVLEVGVGAGNILERVDGAEKHGVDISDYVLGRARERLGDSAVLVKGDAEALPYSDA